MNDKLSRRGFLKGALGAIGAAGATIVVPPMVITNEILQPHLKVLTPENTLHIIPDPLDILAPDGFDLVLRFPGGAEFQGKFITRALSYSQQWPEPITLEAGDHMMYLDGPSTLDLELITAPGNEPTWSTWEDSNV